MKSIKTFKPNILVFCCNWCSYAGADLAGVSRLQIPADFKVVRVMCSARISPEMVMKALSGKIDGVMVLGCHIGDCHYIDGNHRTKKRFALLKPLLECVGIDSRRLYVDWVSASEGVRFQELIIKFIETIKEIGQNPLVKDCNKENERV